MNYIKMISIISIVCMMLCGGCASSRSGKVYTRDQARVQLTVYYGTVLQVEPVSIEGTKSAAGPALGAATGAALGNAVGSGTGRTIATVMGGVAGSLLGGAIEEGVTRKNALEITVEMDDGQIIAVVQEADDVYMVGDRVRIVKSADGTTRVRQ